MNDFEIRVGGEIRVETRGLAKLIRGYPIVFNRLSENLGGFRERIAPEAMDRSLRERADLRALFNHDANLVLGRVPKTLRVQVDAIGLLTEIDPPNSELGRSVVESIDRGDVTGGSFAFMPVGESESWWDFKADPPIRTVRDMLVREVSIVTFPAYPDTALALRSLTRYGGRRADTATVTARLAALEKRRF